MQNTKGLPSSYAPSLRTQQPIIPGQTTDDTYRARDHRPEPDHPHRSSPIAGFHGVAHHLLRKLPGNASIDRARLVDGSVGRADGGTVGAEGHGRRAHRDRARLQWRATVGALVQAVLQQGRTHPNRRVSRRYGRVPPSRAGQGQSRRTGPGRAGEFLEQCGMAVQAAALLHSVTIGLWGDTSKQPSLLQTLADLLLRCPDLGMAPLPLDEVRLLAQSLAAERKVGTRCLAALMCSSPARADPDRAPVRDRDALAQSARPGHGPGGCVGLDRHRPRHPA